MEARDTGMTFGVAVSWLQAGKKLQRAGWTSKGMWIVLMPSLNLPPHSSQEPGAKVNDRTAKHIGLDTPLNSQPYLALWTDQGTWQPGWNASTPDLLADDWQVVECPPSDQFPATFQGNTVDTGHFTDMEPTWGSWGCAELLSVDTETTGLSPHHDRVIEIGAIRCLLGGQGTVALNQRFNPDRPIPPRVTEINGISDADVANAPRFATTWKVRREFLDLERPRRIWVGNNADFDHSMLLAEFARERIGPRHWCPTWLDVKVLLKAIDGVDRFARGYRMANMLPRFGLEYQGRAHSALVDAVANLDLLLAMVQQYPEHLPTPAAALALQAHWLDTAG